MDLDRNPINIVGIYVETCVMECTWKELVIGPSFVLVLSVFISIIFLCKGEVFFQEFVTLMKSYSQ